MYCHAVSIDLNLLCMNLKSMHTYIKTEESREKYILDSEHSVSVLFQEDHLVLCNQFGSSFLRKTILPPQNFQVAFRSLCRFETLSSFLFPPLIQENSLCNRSKLLQKVTIVKTENCGVQPQRIQYIPGT